MANPTLKPFSIASLFPDMNQADTIIVPSTLGMGQRTYTYKRGEWGYSTYEPVYDTDGTTVLGLRSVRVKASEHPELMTVAPGQGFWYISNGGAPTIKWQ